MHTIPTGRKCSYRCSGCMGRRTWKSISSQRSQAVMATMRWTSILMSLLLVGFGWLGAETLVRVDQDLRVIYAEYTLAATDLGHLNGELIRYRTSVIRAIETDAK